jgi:hypothetical protein
LIGCVGTGLFGLIWQVNACKKFDSNLIRGQCLAWQVVERTLNKQIKLS